jgi:hypothetical protein
MSEYESRLKLLAELNERAERGDLEAARSLRRIARQRRKRIEAVNGHAIPNGRNGESISLNRLNRRKRMGLA